MNYLTKIRFSVGKYGNYRNLIISSMENKPTDDVNKHPINKCTVNVNDKPKYVGNPRKLNADRRVHFNLDSNTYIDPKIHVCTKTYADILKNGISGK